MSRGRIFKPANSPHFQTGGFSLIFKPALRLWGGQMTQNFGSGGIPKPHAFLMSVLACS